ncbi:hypothetical protein Patl1_17605 [Pistacia atlantica]|uniref:Uncharacterized protein n=1 Tax=Pistacia atlantica TaxID=434234 RepID=A0ACC1C1M5_9ROSI|nr:hypothetical protein Patl1_17605 [Pistacia atlantica]
MTPLLLTTIFTPGLLVKHKACAYTTPKTPILPSSAFHLFFNRTDHQGSINFIGTDPTLLKTRDISVVGGTGDFFMHRGITTLMTGAYEGDVYFRLRVDI